LVPSFFNVFSSQAINFFLIFTFGGAMAGSYFMAYKIVLLPSTLLSSAFSDIFYQRLIEKKNKSLPVASFISMNARYLLCVGLIFTATIIFFGPQLFMFAFGDKWLLSGNISRIIIFSFLIKFVVSPLTIAFTALDKLNLGAKWQSFMFVSHSLCLLLLYVFKASFYPAIIILTLYEVTIYLVGYFLIAKISGDFDKNKITS
jgi:O-antigen/teichoic acid export membrane protein